MNNQCSACDPLDHCEGITTCTTSPTAGRFCDDCEDSYYYDLTLEACPACHVYLNANSVVDGQCNLCTGMAQGRGAMR